MPGRFTDHADRPARVGLAEHHARGTRLDDRLHKLDDLARTGGDMRRINQAQPTALVFDTLDRRDGPLGPLGHRRIVEVWVEVLVLLDEHQERTAGDLLDQPLDVVGRDPGRRLENRSERRLIECESRLLANPDRPISRAGECRQHVVGDLQRDQAGVLVLVHVEDDRAGDRVQQVARGHVPVGVPHHLEWKGDVQQADPTGRVERIDAGLPCRALLQQRALGRVLDAAGGVIADLLDGLGQGPGAKGEVIGRDHMIGNAGRGVLAQSVGDHLPQQLLAGVKIIPEPFQRRGCQCIHSIRALLSSASKPMSRAGDVW